MQLFYHLFTSLYVHFSCNVFLFTSVGIPCLQQLFFKNMVFEDLITVHQYIKPASESIPLCSHGSFTFLPPSPSLQSPYEMLQFAGKSSTAISFPAVAIWASFSTSILSLPAVSERKNGCDPMTLNSCQPDLNWDSFLFSLGTPALLPCCGGCL